jgi:hypothetical protein
MVDSIVDNILNMHRQLFRSRHKNGCDACLICSLKVLKNIYLNEHLVLPIRISVIKNTQFPLILVLGVEFNF